MKRVLLVVAVFLACAFVYLWPVIRTIAPLVRTRAFVAVCRTSDGARIPGTVYRAMGLPDRVYLRIPGDDRYCWFAVDFKHAYVGAPNWPKTDLGITCVRTDQHAGVDLIDGKIGDGWEVAFSPRHVNFKNRSLNFSLEATNDN